MKLIHKAIIGLLFTIGFSSQGYSWGVLGHKTTAKIAWDLLQQDPSTIKMINDILVNEDFVNSSVWADQIKGQGDKWKHTYSYHFEGIPNNSNFIESLKNKTPDQQKAGGPVEALLVAEKILLDKKASREDKAMALKFMIHFVSDLHQPLHTGPDDDRGGNDHKLTFFGKPMNLHSLWDSQIIFYGHLDMFNGQSYENQFKLYADFLTKKFKKFNPNTVDLTSYQVWTDESMPLRLDVYKSLNLSDKDYTAKFIEKADYQLFLSGVRLAYKIQSILHPDSAVLESPHFSTVDLQKNIQKVVGNFFNFISLKPAVQNQDFSYLNAVTIPHCDKDDH